MSDFNFNIDKEKLTNFLKLYIDKFWGKHWEQEKYKWEAVACFQDNWDIDASDFMKMFVEATKEANPTTGSLINSRRNKSLDDLKNIVKFNDPEEVRNLFKDLYNEELQIEDRIKAFIDGTDELRKKCTNEIKPEYKQKDSVMTYLWLMYPEKYCIYKFSSCVKLSKKIGSNYNPKGGLLDDVLGSIKFFDKIRLIVRDNKEILDILQNCNKEIKFKKLKCEFAQKGAEKWLNTLISDLGYFIGVYDIDVHVDNYSKNIILYGPPGTGKTYNIVLKAMNIIAPEKNYSDSNYNDAKTEYDKLTEEGRIQFVTFHQSYGYEDFIQGIKAKTDNGNISYLVEDGIFKKFCDSARGKKDDNGNSFPYIFIIDEINRGNISKIFGELITLIEDTKRKGKLEETSAILPYSGDKFTVPDNVYIIGTMNTADRSLAVVDTALRRRFSFEEMMPDTESDLLDFNVKADGGETINIKNLLKIMNDRITALYDREHTIGHAYFMSLSSSSTIKDLGNIFKNKIIPLLQEYFYEDYEKIRLVLGDNQKVNDESLKDDKINNHEFIKIVKKGTDTLFGDANVLNGETVLFYEINVNDDYNVFNDVLAYKKLQK